MNFTEQEKYTAIVTGSTRGIDKETALLLLQKGLNVIISSRSQQSVDNVIQAIVTNLKSVFLFTKEVLPYMIENKSGVIVNVSSGAGKSGFPNLSAYCASKFGVIGFTESIAERSF